MDLLLFALFVFYGPSISSLGELRYVEIVIAVLPLLFAQVALGRTGYVTSRLSALFLLTAAVQLFSDMYNGSDPASTAKRVGSYVILAVLVVSLRWLCYQRVNRLRLILLGYCLSYVTLMIVGSSASIGYALEPWRLGLGFAATLAVCVIASWHERGALYGGMALIAIASIHVIEQSRSLAMFSAAAGTLSLVSALRGGRYPSLFSPRNTVILLTMSVALLVGALQGVRLATNLGLFPSELQIKMEQQLSSPAGLLAAARPDTFAALYAIGKRPFLGYGSSGFDNDVWGYYVELATSSYVYATSSYANFYNSVYTQEWNQGIPSHSHLFGAWADAGILATLCWFATLALAIYVMFRAWRWQTPFAPLLFFICINTLWDVLFSPGPHRMDIALRIEVMTFAVLQMHASDRLLGRSATGAAHLYPGSTVTARST